MKVGGLDVKGSHLGVGDLDALLVGSVVEPAGDGGTGVSGCIGNQLNDHLVADQRFAAPVLCDEGEQPLDPVPLAGARWEVTDGDRYSEFVGQNAEFPLPQAQPNAVAATAIGGDQQPRRGGIAGGTELVPPAADTLDGEHCVSWLMPRLTHPALSAMS